LETKRGRDKLGGIESELYGKYTKVGNPQIKLKKSAWVCFWEEEAE